MAGLYLIYRDMHRMEQSIKRLDAVIGTSMIPHEEAVFEVYNSFVDPPVMQAPVVQAPVVQELNDVCEIEDVHDIEDVQDNEDVHDIEAPSSEHNDGAHGLKSSL
jgi:hypothetical protein